MVDPWKRQHGLAHRAPEAAAVSPEGAGVRLWLEEPCVQLALRGGGRAFERAVSKVLGVAPSATSNTAASAGARRVLWLGPDEWLAVCPGDADTAGLVAALEDALSGQHALVSDVSHSRVILGLEGPRARDVLMKGCSLDLDPVGFAAGRCAQTGLARAHMLLHQVSDAPRYHVYAHRSFADYIYSWLADAAGEYGVALGPPP